MQLWFLSLSPLLSLVHAPSTVSGCQHRAHSALESYCSLDTGPWISTSAGWDETTTACLVRHVISCEIVRSRPARFASSFQACLCLVSGAPQGTGARLNNPGAATTTSSPPGVPSHRWRALRWACSRTHILRRAPKSHGKGGYQQVRQLGDCLYRHAAGDVSGTFEP
jgi:hypothetical protein